MISEKRFMKRLIDLCLRSGLSEFPKSEEDQQILLQSASLSLRAGTDYSEKEVSAKLMHWLTEVSLQGCIDHVSLRRRLVDAGYLVRNRDGSCYTLLPYKSELFESAVESIDVKDVLRTARAEIDRRREAYRVKQGQGETVC